MPWVNDKFYYTNGTLRAIAGGYDTVSEVLMIGDYQIVNPYALVEFKADFDMALDSIGKTEWDSLTSTDYNRMTENLNRDSNQITSA